MESLEYQNNNEFSKNLFFEALPKFVNYLSNEDKFELSLVCNAIFNMLKSESETENEIEAISAEERNPKEFVIGIFYNIAQYLEYKDAVEVSTACKALRNVLSPNVFKKIKLQDIHYENYKIPVKPTEFIDRETQSFNFFIISKSSYIQSIQLKNGTISSYNFNFFNDFSNLSAIRFVKCILPDSILLSILNKLRFLKEFFLFACHIQFTVCELICNLPESLKILWVQGRKYPLPYNILKVFNSHKGLKKANILCHTMITPFLNHYSSLKRLQINYCEYISFDDFITILKRNPQIKKLSFSADYLVNNQFVIFEHINQLPSLHITKGNLEIPEISFFLQNLKEVIIEAKLSNNSFFNVVRSNQHLVEIYFHIELPQEVYQEILNLKYIKIISFRSVNPRWVRRLSKIPTIERLTWIKKPSIGYIVSIISRACINYNMQYIKGKFSIIF